MPDITSEKILAMEAGTELDALVAERVMGWHLYSGEARAPNGIPWIDNDGVGVGRSHPAGWSPSTDIAAAWEVVEQMGHEMKLEYIGSAKVTFRVTSSRQVSATGTAPLAICRAALLSILGDSE